MANVLKKELALFDKKPTQVAIKSASWVDNYPVGSLNGGPIEFFIAGTAEHYIDLNDTFLEVHYNVKRGDAFITGDDLTGASPFLYSLFNDVQVFLNEKQIEGGMNTHPYRAFFETELGFGYDAKSTHLAAGGYCSDNDDALAIVKGNHDKQLMGPIFANIFQQEKYLIPKVDLRLKFIRNLDAFSLISTIKAGEVENARITITKAVLHSRKVLCEPSILNAHETGLNTKNITYPINEVNVNTFTIPKGTTTYNRDNLFLGKIPKLIVIGLVTNEAYSGNFKTNPFKFEPHNVNYLSILKEGESVPYRPFTPDFKHDIYKREYLAMFNSLNSAWRDRGNYISLDEYKTTKCLYVFNIAPDLAVDLNQPRKEGNLRLDIRFNTATDKALNVVVYCINDAEVIITKMRDVQQI